MSGDIGEMEAFLAGECGLLQLDRAVITWREYRTLELWYMAQREYNERLIRMQCFYSVAPHQGKKSKIKKPDDLWRIGDEGAGIPRGEKLTRQQKKHNKEERDIVAKEMAEKGIKLRIV